MCCSGGDWDQPKPAPDFQTGSCDLSPTTIPELEDSKNPTFETEPIGLPSLDNFVLPRNDVETEPTFSIANSSTAPISRARRFAIPNLCAAENYSSTFIESNAEVFTMILHFEADYSQLNRHDLNIRIPVSLQPIHRHVFAKLFLKGAGGNLLGEFRRCVLSRSLIGCRRRHVPTGTLIGRRVGDGLLIGCRVSAGAEGIALI